MKFSSFNEWGPLRRVLVGTIGDYREHHFDASFKSFFWDNISAFIRTQKFDEYCRSQGTAHPTIPIDERIVEELEEDIEGLASAMVRMGIEVVRPNIPEKIYGSDIQTPFWRSKHFDPLNVRDNSIIFGDVLLETAPHVRGRLLENIPLKVLFSSHFEAGGRWLSMPLPALAGGGLDLNYHADMTDHEVKDLFSQNSKRGDLNYTEILFDGAQCIRFGSNVLVNVSNLNQELGFRWLQRELGDKVNFHLWNCVTDGHLDSTILPLRDGLILLRSPDLVSELPDFLKDWETIFPPKPSADLFPSYSGTTIEITSKFIDMNILSVDEKTVIANSLFPELIEVLERNGLNVIPVRHRHRRLFGGGFHCFTLDLNRG